MCESSPSIPKYLCAYHTELFAFLENGGKPVNGTGGKDGGPSVSAAASGEAAKYLPKKAPLLPTTSPLSDPKRDLMMIRAASTLLQELWDGKLRATVKSFTKKVAGDMSLRRRLETTANATQTGLVVPPTPSWAVWRDEKVLSGTLTAQATRHAALDSMRVLETAVSAEIKHLTDLRVYPSAELAQIRKEVKAFRDTYDETLSASASASAFSNYGSIYATASTGSDEAIIASTAAELKLCERKLAMLRAKRQEETEARQAALRKAQRQAQVLESQRADPQNFSFAQGRM